MITHNIGFSREMRKIGDIIVPLSDSSGRVLDLKSKGLLVEDSPEALFCVL